MKINHGSLYSLAHVCQVAERENKRGRETRKGITAEERKRKRKRENRRQFEPRKKGGVENQPLFSHRHKRVSLPFSLPLVRETNCPRNWTGQSCLCRVHRAVLVFSFERYCLQTRKKGSLILF